MGLQVAEALTHAHQQGIVHRDIKPSNLLLDGLGRVWVTDFGLAKAEGADDLTTTGDIVGTLRYMAPERFNGWSDPRSDVYGLGATVYELATLRPAFHDSNRARLIERVLHDDPPRPRSLDRHIPRDLETIILKALAKEPGDRYRSAQALAEDIRRFLVDRTIEARRASRLEQTWRWCRRNPAVATLGAAIVLILTGSVLILSRLYFEAKRGEKEARDAAAESRAVLEFFTKRILSAARPKGQEGGLGRDATIHAAIVQAEPAIGPAFAEQPLAEASIRKTLGLTYWFMADYPRAVAQLERALALRKAHLAPDAEETLASMANLAQAYQAAGRTHQALRLHEEILKLRQVKLGPDHAETLWTMNRLAMAHCTAGNLDEALPLLEEGLARARVALGPHHNDTLIYMDCLAVAYRHTGRLSESIKLHEETLELEKADIGPEHPDTLATMNNLGVVYYEAGRFNEALALLEKTLSLRRSKLGAEHVDVLSTMSNLAAVYRDVGRLGEAMPLAEDAFRVERSRARPDDPYTLVFAANLATTYRDAGRFAEAVPLYEETLRLQKLTLRPDHYRRLPLLNDFGECLIRMKKYHDAVVPLRECLSLREQKAAPDWWLFQTRSQLGRAAAGLKRYAEAESLLLEAHGGLLARKDSIPGRHAHAIGDTARALANLYDAWGKPEQATRWRQEARIGD
jgi:tetratricopeptide (TPR) repeat protein